MMQINEKKSSIHKSGKSSILKSRFSNVETKCTYHQEQVPWKDKKSFQCPSHQQIMNNFRKLQMSILGMFTQAKNKLSNLYRKINGQVKNMNTILLSQKYDMNEKFMLMLEEIEDQIQQKSQQLSYNMQSVLVSSKGFEKLSQFLMDRRKMSLRKLNKSVKSVNSIKSMYNYNKNNKKVLTSGQQVNDEDYKYVVRIQLFDKRCENLGWLTGNWQCLQKLKLYNKNIIHIIPFQTFKAVKLKQLQITSNQIIDIQFLMGSYYPNLIKLNLKNNKISKISGIQQTDFPSLKFLNLSFNKIQIIQPLTRTYFPQLVQLSLNSNRIQSIKQLKQCDYPNLQVLNIDKNRICSIKALQQCRFNLLKILSFCYNKIRSLQFIKNVNFNNLQALLGYNNQLRDIRVLEQCEFPKLKQLLLNNNLIEDITPIIKVKYPNLKQLDLQNNKFKNKQFLCFLSTPKSITKAKKKYPFLQI